MKKIYLELNHYEVSILLKSLYNYNYFGLESQEDAVIDDIQFKIYVQAMDQINKIYE